MDVQTSIEFLAREAFHAELNAAGLWKVRIPPDPADQRALLGRIDALLAQSAELDRRGAPVEGADGKLQIVPVTVEDALASQRRSVVSALMSATVGAAATHLEEAIAESTSAEVSAQMRGAIGDLNEVKRLADEQSARNEGELLREERRAELKARMADRRRDRWFTRDSIAALAGALLLMGFAVVLVVMMFQGKQPSDIISNAFLLILGFFFGQGTRAGKGDN